MNRTIILKNNTGDTHVITDLFNFEVSSLDVVVLSDYFKQLEISESNVLVEKIASGIFTVNNGEEDLSAVDGIKYCTTSLSYVNIEHELRDRSGKLRVHQTSRRMGTVILWTGQGDDSSDPTNIGGGEDFSFNYVKGTTSDPLEKYIDFNIVENETWVHEGYVTWKNCHLDTLDLMIVPRITDIITSSGTNYNLYGGYLVVPTIPGTGTIDVVSDITTHSGGLIYMPEGDLGEVPIAYWNADWNTSTKRYENITAAPNGDGRYNMFSMEVPFAHFVRKMPLLDSGFIALNSSDTDQLGHGMRLKIVADTNTTSSGVGEHDWALACTMCLHREKTT